MEPRVLDEPVLVGREQELAELQRYLESANEGKGTAVFVSGEAGSGKTRLVNEFLNTAKQRNFSVLSGWCLSNAAVPYFPFVEAFESYSSMSESFDSQQLKVKTLLSGTNQAESQNKNENMNAQVWKDQTFAAVLKELLLMATKKPLILFIDDIHWADSASLSLLHYITRGISSERILFIATFRSEEIFDRKAGEKPHPLVETLRLMGREGIFKEITIRDLSQSEVRKIAESMLGGSVNPNLVQKLSIESGGGPLFVVESLRMMFESGSLFQRDGSWQLSVDKLGIPSKVKDIILRRLNSLTSIQRRTLDVASVMGDKFDPQLLAAVLNIDSLEALETLNSIALSKSLVGVEGDHYKFDHAKTQEVIYDEILLPLRNGYHERIAEKIETSNLNSKQLSLSDLAYHYTQAGNKAKSLEYNLAAGKDAVAKFSNTEAVKCFTYALANIPQTIDQIEKKTIALEGLGDAYYANSMFKQATKTFEDLSNYVTGACKLRALRKAMESTFQYMDIPHLIELVKRAEPYASADRLENARVLTQRGRTYVFQGMPKLAIKDWGAALPVFEEENSFWDAALALVGLGINHAGIGEQHKGIAESLRAIALFEELGDFRFQMEGYIGACMTFCMCLLDNEVLGMGSKTIEIDEKTKMGDYQRLAYANAFSAFAYEDMDNWGKALSYCLKALELAKKVDSPVAIGMIYSNLSRVYVRLGNLKHAEEYFEKLTELSPELLLHPYVGGLLTKAAFFAGKNQWKESNQCFKEFLEEFKAYPNHWWEHKTKSYFAWALERQGRVEEAKVQFEDAKRMYRETAERFSHVSLQASLMVRRQVVVGEEFEIYLDIVNVSRKPSRLVRVDNLVPLGFRVVGFSLEDSLRDGSIVLKENVLEPFSVKSIRLSLQATTSGNFTLRPQVRYVNDFGQTRIANFNPVKFSVMTAPLTAEPKPSVEIGEANFEFKSEVAQKAFSFLVKAFAEDYVRLKLPQERSGWRTLMDLVKEGHVSQYSVYGFAGHQGRVLSELKRSSLVEARVFLGERGRGGKILKLRVNHEKENVRRLIDSTF